MNKDPRSKAKFDEPSPHLEEKRISGKPIYEGNFLKFHSDLVLSSDGHKSQREYAVHPGAVAILPFLDESTLLLERQWRYPLNKSFLEFPAGKIDKNEAPIVTARRELLEETGFTANEWAYLGEFHPVSSYSTEVIYLFMAREMNKKSSPKTDNGECIDLVELKIREFFDLIDSNLITDAKTMSLGYWLLRFINSDFSPDWMR